MALDPNEAPEGLFAVECSSSDACDLCLFDFGTRACDKQSCTPASRKDKCWVYFAKSNGPIHASAIWPYDDMCAPVEVTQ